ncbi:YbaB/EbfC family nucleoid-associated protein [Nonomuraea lactucae]|uniref:YbaB/EbfC family nucleoid-associated protein n=1 Tax=Nonomuraea lactucae TaxID=2249762 RepID=UPI0013B475E8|nr:YbaB/EbfC family nucleoid-associated protein [Nonomuraea lactucae]
MKHAGAFGAGREGDLSGLLREVNGWVGSLAEALGELKEETVEGADPTGAVRAGVSGTGRLRALSIDPRGLRDLDHVELAEAVQAAIVAAHLAMGERLTELVRGLPGGPDDAGDGGDPLDSFVRHVLRGE